MHARTHAQIFNHDGPVPALALQRLMEAAEATTEAGNVEETCMATLESLVLGQACLASVEMAVRALGALKCVLWRCFFEWSRRRGAGSVLNDER
jgi:hypothetical protein